MYLRFAALGDSATLGIGDPVAGGWRGWASLLAQALSVGHDLSFCKLAVSGATAATVRRTQLEAALAHRPQLASLVVGVNDTMRSTWDVGVVRDDLLACAAALDGVGATLLTARFHDHGAVFGLPGFLRRPLAARIEQVNLVYDEIHARHGSLRVDLAVRPEVACREFWSVDRLHPSELGHRVLAHAYAGLLAGHGISVEPPSPLCDGAPSDWRTDLRWIVTEGAPWMGRRARDLGPWAARLALTEARPRGRGRRPAAAVGSTAGR